MNSTKLNTILNALKIAIIVIGVGASLLLIFNGSGVLNEGNDAVVAFREGSEMNTAIFFTIAVLVLSMALVLVFFILQLATNTKRTVISIIGLIAALLIYFIFLALGTSDTTDSLQLKNPVEQATVNTTTAGIFTVLIGLAAGVLVIILGPFMGRLRK